MNEPSFPPQMPAVQATPITSEERTWAMMGHLSALCGLITGCIGCIVGPLIIWQMKKETMPFAASEAKEALNFNISWLLWLLGLVLLVFILAWVLIGFFLIPFLFVYPLIWAIFSIVGGLRANDGRPYRYPLTIRFIK